MVDLAKITFAIDFGEVHDIFKIETSRKLNLVERSTAAPRIGVRGEV